MLLPLLYFGLIRFQGLQTGFWSFAPFIHGVAGGILGMPVMRDAVFLSGSLASNEL